MIDFENATFLKLMRTDSSAFISLVEDLLIDDEEVMDCYRGIRDGVIFTDRRVIAVNVQGITGKKKDFTSLPYNKVQAFSVETSGVMDLDSELEMWFSTLGLVRFEFLAGADVEGICSLISAQLL